LQSIQYACKRIALVTLGLVLTTLVLPAFAQPNRPNIANFAEVTPGLFRGAQPSETALVDLSRAGVKSIIDLRKSGTGTIKEKALAQRLGMNYFHIPMGYLGPPPHKVIKFLKLVLNEDNRPVFVHCRQGADRTGTMIAVYRMVVQGWSLNQVYPEMHHHHFKPWLVALKRTVENYSAGEPLAAGSPLFSLKPVIENYTANHPDSTVNQKIAGSKHSASL
jgi:protein tyrosine phosphatase (PTP) superfamily phosphohydrolase (DUF442 family)